jgi:hypothetical protein
MIARFLFSRGGRSAVVVEHSALSSLQKLSGKPTCIDVAKQPTFDGPLSPGDKPPALSLVPVQRRIQCRSTAHPPLPSDVADNAFAQFAEAYADQNERDYQALGDAAASHRLAVEFQA